LHLREGTDLCHRGVCYSPVQVQSDHALLDPLRTVRSAHRSPSPRGNSVALRIDHSKVQMSDPECERFCDDIAVLAVGALDGVEKCRLLRHLDGCLRCEALREDYVETAMALEVVIPVATEPCGLLDRIMDSIRSSRDNTSSDRVFHS
jgi:hypothetical protein